MRPARSSRWFGRSSLARAVIERAELPAIAADRFDDPAELDAFLDAVRWGAVTSADQRSLQAPFRSGITIEDYQLEPLVRALRMPRTNLLIADDVGLGKTIEAGLVVQELLLRHRARTALVVCPAVAAAAVARRDAREVRARVPDRRPRAARAAAARRAASARTRSTHFPRLIVSIDWLKARPRHAPAARGAAAGAPRYPRRYDLLIVDEVHNCAPAGAGGRYARDTLRTAGDPDASRRTASTGSSFPPLRTTATTTPSPRCSSCSIHTASRAGSSPTPEATREVTVRRLKQDLLNEDGSAAVRGRRVVMLEVEHPRRRAQVHADLVAYGALAPSASAATRRRKAAADFVVTLLKKRLFSSPAAFLRTLEVHRETLLRGQRTTPAPTPTVLQRLFDDARECA